MRSKGLYNAPDLRRAFKTPEGSYQLKTESRHGQVSYMDRQAARMTMARMDSGTEKGTYVVLNVGESLHILQYKADEGDSVKVVYFRRDVCPTCHSFADASDQADLLVGLSNGEVMLLSLRALLQGLSFTSQVSPIAVFTGAYKADDDVQCTSVMWTSNDNPTHFLATYSDGNLRIFDKSKVGIGVEQRPTRTIVPDETMNIGGGCITDASISPDGKKLAVVSKDGILRIFCATSRLLQTGFQSYYGGLLCCAWSPDSKYVATGGEDDLVAVFSVEHGNVIAWGEGHTSWISQVAFDAGIMDTTQDDHFCTTHEPQSLIYRVGSVSQDTQVALWDFEVDRTLPATTESIAATNGGVEESDEVSCIALAIPHRDMVTIPPVMLHKLHPDPVTDIVFTSSRMFTCDYSGHVRYWAKPEKQTRETVTFEPL